MSAQRVVAALRELADALEASGVPEAVPSRTVRRRRSRAIPAPSGPIDAEARARVEKRLKDSGWSDAG